MTTNLVVGAAAVLGTAYCAVMHWRSEMEDIKLGTKVFNASDQPGVPIEKTKTPLVVKKAFKPEEILGCPASGWIGLLRGLCPKLPVQLHCEPYAMDGVEGNPVFLKTLSVLRGIAKEHSDVGDLIDDAKRARIKFRVSAKGKFVHRNRYQRHNIICCMEGEATWLFVESHTGKADAILDATSNDNWNGYRSRLYPTMLTVAEMHEIAERARAAGAEAIVMTVQAGDVMTFDGRWWHATSYDVPMLNMFFTPGKDMEIALREHDRRMSMPRQKGLKMGVINMAKCAKLSDDWQRALDGKKVDWGSPV